MNAKCLYIYIYMGGSTYWYSFREIQSDRVSSRLKINLIPCLRDVSI